MLTQGLADIHVCEMNIIEHVYIMHVYMECLYLTGYYLISRNGKYICNIYAMHSKVVGYDSDDYSESIHFGFE